MRTRKRVLFKHGLCQLPEYRVWLGLRKRCFSQKCKQYKDYGGRGITVCERWDDFRNFLSDMGSRPEKGTLDRIDNDGNYEPGNCKWSSRKEQANNRRTSHIIEYNGESKTIAQWSNSFGIDNCVVRGRIKMGWSIQDALCVQPIIKGSQRKGHIPRGRKAILDPNYKRTYKKNRKGSKMEMKLR